MRDGFTDNQQVHNHISILNKIIDIWAVVFKQE